MNEIRKLKVESLLRSRLASMILYQEIKDPRVTTFLTVNSVSVSNDLSYAKVYIGSFQKDSTLGVAVEALNHAVGFIHGFLGKHLPLRTVPKLSFFVDNSVQAAMDLNRIIDEANSH
jgi:ribosome-binding factor A